MFFLEVVVAKNKVWSDINTYLGGTSSAIAIHTFVFKGRHGIKEKLGILKNVVPSPQLSEEKESGK